MTVHCKAPGVGGCIAEAKYVGYCEKHVLITLTELRIAIRLACGGSVSEPVGPEEVILRRVLEAR